MTWRKRKGQMVDELSGQLLQYKRSLSSSLGVCSLAMEKKHGLGVIYWQHHHVGQHSRSRFWEREENSPSPSESQFWNEVSSRYLCKKSILGIKWQDEHYQIPMDVINKTAMSPWSSKKKKPQAFLNFVGYWIMCILIYSLIVNPSDQVTQMKNNFTWSSEQKQFFE